MSRIQHNMSAMNTHRMYTINNTAAAKSAEKLSSGYRINRAGDDAAGLAISEKMRAQIRGLNMASKNSQDAISLVQTAEGALQEVHSMLQRMSELATQSNTGTNEDFDRSAISAEFEQLKSEINDIAEQTTFNNMKLFDGSLGASKMKVGDASTLKTGETLTGTGASFVVTDHSGITNTKAGNYAITADTSSIKVEFTDNDGNKTVTNIDMNDAVDSSKVGSGKSFSLDLSAAGLGKYTMAATGASVDTATLAEAINGKTVVASAIVDETDASKPVGSVTSTAGSVTTPATNTTFTIDLAGLATTTANGAVTIEFSNADGGNNTLATKTGLTASSDAAAIAASIAGGAAGADATVDIDGEVFTATAAGTVLTLTSANAGTLSDALINKLNTMQIEVQGSLPTTAAPTNTGSTSVTPGASDPGDVKGTVTLAMGSFDDIVNGSAVTIDGTTYEFKVDDDYTQKNVGSTLVDLSTLGSNEKTSAKVAEKLFAATTATTTNFDVVQSGTNLILTQKTAAKKTAGEMASYINVKVNDAPENVDSVGKGVVIQVGANKGETLSIAINKMNAEGLGVQNLSIAEQGENVGQAGDAIKMVKEAINTVSEQRASLGAMQNRLEHKIKNLDNSAENLQSAEASIRDVDMASEMTEYQKQNILSQAATAMLAQANAAPQNVLQLLG